MKPRLLDSFNKYSDIITSAGADFAEVAEWSDGNPDEEDRVGYFVSVDNTESGITMVKANSTSDVRGVTMRNPGFSANANPDKFDENGKLLPQYSYVGFVGFVPVYDNGRCTINEKCIADDDGTAKPSDTEFGYQVIDRVDENRVLILIEPQGDNLYRLSKKNTSGGIEVDYDEYKRLEEAGEIQDDVDYIVPNYPHTDGAVDQELDDTSENAIANKAVTAELNGLKSNFQDGVDGIYDAIVAQGTTPSSKSQSDVVNGIDTMATNKYNAGVSATKKGTATADKVLSGYTFTNSNDVEISGNMEEKTIHPNIFVCVGGKGRSYYSTDGTTWTAMSGLDASTSYYGVTYGNGRFVCVGDDGESYYSTDGLTWIAMSGLNTSKFYNGVTYGNDRFICVGEEGESYYSTDGTTWTAMDYLLPAIVFNGSNYVSSNYNGIIYGNDRFVCVGDAGKSYYSTNGTTWTAMSGLDISINYYDVTYGNDRFVCVGSRGKSYYSTDGTTWIAMSGLDSATCYGVTYGNGKFVCVGTNGGYYSIDGVTWIAISELESFTYYNVTYSNGRFVCVGALGKSYYSTNGITWTSMSSLVIVNYYGIACAILPCTISPGETLTIEEGYYPGTTEITVNITFYTDLS